MKKQKRPRASASASTRCSSDDDLMTPAAKKLHLDNSTKLMGTVSKLFNKKEHSDLVVTFPKSRTELYLHRGLICESSDFFGALCKDELSGEELFTVDESDDEELLTEIFQGCYFIAMKAMVKDKSKIVPMIRLAQKYQFHQLTSHLITYLLESMDIKANLFQYLNLGEGNDSLSRQVRQKLGVELQKFSKDVWKSELYRTLSFEQWEKVLMLMVHCDNRLEAYDAIHSWVSFDVENRGKYSLELSSIVVNAKTLFYARFDPKYCTCGALTTKANRRVLNVDSDGCVAVGTKCNEFSIRLIKKCGALSVGMTSNPVVKKDEQSTNEWHVICEQGKLCSCTVDKPIPFGKGRFSEGTVLGVRVRNGEFHFSVDGVDSGVAFRGLPDELYPVFELDDKDCEFEFFPCNSGEDL